MATFTFSDEEQKLLTEILEREIPSLREEILHTDDHDYREFLKKREEVLKSLASKTSNN
ncbi:MAG: hypothetical protein AB7G75_06390 [Candidatus Binatia bacterium]